MANDPGKKPVIHTKKHVARLERERQQTRLILYIFIGIIALVVGLIGYGYLDIKYFQLRKPVAIVGGNEITLSQFEARVRLQRQQLLTQYSQYSQYQQIFGMDLSAQIKQIQTELDTPINVGQAVLDRLVNEELIRLEAAKRGIIISDKEINNFKQEAFNYFPNGTPTPTLTPTEFVLPSPPAEAFKLITMTPTASATPMVSETPVFTSTTTPGGSAPETTATLEPTPTATIQPTATTIPTIAPTTTPLPTATPYTLEGFQTQLADNKDQMIKLGFSEKDYQSLFEIQLLETKLKDAITADISHTEEQVWARHILVADPAIAVTIIGRLKNGEDFAALAGEFSTDTASAAKGGDLGWFGKGAMVPEFETAVFALEKSGDFTQEPVKSNFGYHIIQLIAKQVRPLTADQYDKARTAEFDKWLTAAKDEYGVETFDFWKGRIPTEPNFITAATESANAQKTAQAKALDQRGTESANPTATP